MGRILVIDDEPAALKLLTLTLERAGHEVIACLSAIQGLAEAQDRQPDLILTDLMMPKMTGYEFCRQARTIPKLETVPIVIFSARFQPIDKQTALEVGATDYLSKTTPPRQLVQRITELIPPASATDAHRLIGFFSLRGGIGVTSLAVNTTIALARARKVETALIDLNLVGGHAALMFDLRPIGQVLDLLLTDNDQEVSFASIRAKFIQHSSGVHLLASSMSYEYQLSTASQERLCQLVDVLKSELPVTVFDIGRFMLTPSFAPVLQKLDTIALILSPDMPSLQSTVVALQGLVQLGVSEEKVVLVVNQPFVEGALTGEVIQNALRRTIVSHIPYEPAMAKAINSRQPLLLSNPKTKGAAAIARLSSVLYHH